MLNLYNKLMAGITCGESYESNYKICFAELFFVIFTRIVGRASSTYPTMTISISGPTSALYYIMMLLS